jgi:DNA-3-methyladenine glycosylase
VTAITPRAIDDFTPLPPAFYARDADEVARDLLGRVLVHDAGIEGEPARVARVVETEAYYGPPGANPRLAARGDLPKGLHRALLQKGDPASHAFPGPTPRNRLMFGPPGHAYVYLIYGMHECLNVTTGLNGDPQAVLFRAAELPDQPPVTASGPARLTRALRVTRALNGVPITDGDLFVADAPPVTRVHASPRVGVTRAADYRLRFVDAGSRAVSRGPKVGPLRGWGGTP